MEFIDEINESVMIMDLLHLRYFSAVAQYGSVTEAAKKLHISQSTISISIKKLEEEFDLKLFEKDGRGIQLTEAGRIILPTADKLLEDAENLRLMMVQAAKEIQQELTVAVEADDFVMEARDVYLSFYPGSHINIVPLRNGDLDFGWPEDSVDFCVTMRDCSNEDLVSEPVLQDRMLAVIGERNPLSQKFAVWAKDLRNEPIVCLPEGSVLRELFEEYLAGAGVVCRNWVDVTDLEAIPTRVNHLQGVSFVPESVVSTVGREFYRHEAVLPLEEPAFIRKIYLTRRRSEPAAGNDEPFREFLREFGRRTEQLGRYPDADSFRDTTS